jgi:hypothetical protein
MSLRTALRRLGNASPMITAGLYTAVAVLIALIHRFWSTNVALALVAFAAGIVAFIGLFIVVTWYRDDDWLAAGFLFALTVYLGNMFAEMLVAVIASRNLGAAVFQAGTASMGTLLRAAITVPISGGIITLARKLSAAWKRRHEAMLRREAMLSKAPLFPTAKADNQSPGVPDQRSGRTT